MKYEGVDIIFSSDFERKWVLLCSDLTECRDLVLVILGHGISRQMARLPCGCTWMNLTITRAPN